MEAPHDATKSKDNMMNFSGSAGDMMAAMQAAGIKVPDAVDAAKKAAAAPPSAPEECNDPSCTVDHDHGGHDHHGHAHGHDHHKEHDHGGHEHGGHDHGDCGGHDHSEHDHKGHDHKGHDHKGHDHKGHDHKGHDHKGHDHVHDHGQHGRASDVTAPVQISCEFDSGNIEVVDASDPTGKGIQLRIRPDVYTELEKKAHMQWFHFKASSVSDGAGDSGPPTKFSIVNAGVCSFPDAWPGTTVCASHDREEWFRCLDTTWDPAAGSLNWTFERKSHPGASKLGSVVYFAYFAPYSWDRHLDFVGKMGCSPLATVKVIGRTLDGRDMDLIKVGTGPLKVWAIHRQHPGESQAEFYAEGLLERLTDRTDALARSVRASCTWYVIPNMNPDGSVRGHLRTNACGANLNREWQTTGNYVAPSAQRSPEVLACLREMDATGVDLFVDVHGDEEIPMNFVSGMEGLQKWGPRLQALQGAFVKSYVRANPDFQSEISYEPEPAKQANLSICSNQIAHRFDCLGVTLEQPFKDCVTMSDPPLGWTPQRCKDLGRSLVNVAAHVAPYLRSTEPFWETMDVRDAYKRPIEGTASSTLPARGTLPAYLDSRQSRDIATIDDELAEAEALVAKLRAKRTSAV